MTIVDQFATTVRILRAYEKEIKRRTRDLIRVHNEAITAAVGDLPELLKSARVLESKLRVQATAALEQAEAERRRVLESGVEVPPIPLPEGVTTAYADVLEQKILTEADILALYDAGLLIPDTKAIKSTLREGEDVPGFRFSSRIQLRVRSE